MTIQDVHTNVQAVRRICETEESVNATTTPTSTMYLVSHPDPASGKDILLWDDILAAFKVDVVHVRSGAVVLPFLKGPDFKNLDPLRIATVPGVTLDVVVRRPMNGSNDLELESQAAASDDITSNSRDAKEPELFSTSDEPFSYDPPEYSTIIIQDFTEIERKAKLGDKEAQFALGEMYKDGRGVEQDYRAAMTWYLKAAEQGDMASQARVAYLYRDGLGVEQDHAAAVKWYLKAAGQGDANSQSSVAYLFEDGLGTPQDFNQAREWYQRAADQGLAVAQSNLGYMYEHGRGVAQDYSRAMKWYLMAADQGQGAAQQNIGNLYHSGRGVSKDFSLAMDWYRKAADQGRPSAYYHIGLLYERGHGVEVNKATAREWYTKAIEGGFTRAKAQLESMNQKEDADKVDKKRGLLRRIFN
ncbi:hypothetical protein BGZ88_003702 [Linnemannia elongata]|nr:hypothetical protein BGZ88_003702 [Linnemannia elongata]